MKIYIPFDAENPKTRLASVLDTQERQELSRSMLRDVHHVIKDSKHEPVVLTTQEINEDMDQEESDKPLSEAVNNALQSNQSIGIVMADLPLIEPRDIESLTDTESDVVLAPGRGGGTNALVSRHTSFHVDFHGASYLDHLEIARNESLDVEVMDSYRFFIDIDEPADLIDLMIHGDREARRYLESIYRLGINDEPELIRRNE